MADSPPKFDPMSVQPEHQPPVGDGLGTPVQSLADRLGERFSRHCRHDTQLNSLHNLMDNASAKSKDPSEKDAIKAEKEVIQALQEVLKAQNEVMDAMEKATLNVLDAELKAILCRKDSHTSRMLEKTARGRHSIMSEMLEKML